MGSIFSSKNDSNDPSKALATIEGTWSAGLDITINGEKQSLWKKTTYDFEQSDWQYYFNPYTV